MGGRSAEREISLKTGEQIYKALSDKGYEAIKIDAGINVAEDLKRVKPDVVFIGLHGRYGEDGTVQGLLEMMELPYTGSGVMASAIAINKAMTKVVMEAAGINTPSFLRLNKSDAQIDYENILNNIGLPLVVKPACEGSTIGINIVHDKTDLSDSINQAFLFDNEIIVEEFVEGTEITVGIIGNDPVALPTLEIVTETDFYDYETKYTAGLSKHIIPARLPENEQEKAQAVALAAHNALGCKGYSRVDIIVDKAGEPFVLEINTLPGMTELSLYPDAARAAGFEFPDLISKLVELALENSKIPAESFL
jgi:D-alanine-D-alanine ligase